MIIHNLTYHVRDGSKWVGLPAREYVKNNEKSWALIVEFDTKETRDKFQAAVLEAISRHIARGGQ